MLEKFKSRKFIMVTLSAILLVLKEGLNIDIDGDVVMSFAGIMVTYLLGQSAVDYKKK
tara:strand:- start:796 stop:969 length:174 start_codon:yes stop_codon:yes gene_type:complete